MNENQNRPKKDQEGSQGTEQKDDKLDMGNDLSLGSVSGAGVSDFSPDNDSPQTEEQEYREGTGNGDDQRSDDNGINPAPAEVDPKKVAQNSADPVENADEDNLNPFPDGLKPDDEEDEKVNSTWMMSGRNKKI